jgi:succinate dehydrogenase / fumarate reductase cytochrome b subunit
MGWFKTFIVSSIGQKIVMTLTGLFLVIFLLVHLAGNLQLLQNDGGKAFNIYTEFMSHNPVIQTVAKLLYAFILIHAVQGVLIAVKNRKAKVKKYAVESRETGTWASKNMALLGILIFAFLMLHMGDFWWKLKFHDDLPMVTYDGATMADAYAKVGETFSKWPFVVAYLIGLVALGFHLLHGFQSAFQTLGLRHKKYTPIIEVIGVVYTVLVTVGFAVLPIYMYFN